MSKPVIILYHPKKDSSSKVNSMPFSLLAISAVIDQSDIDIKIIEGAFVKNIDEEIAKFAGKNILAAGVTAITGPPILDALRFARAIRKFNAKIPIIWGGSHPSINPIDTIKDDNVDYVIKGQGEIPFKKLIDALIKGQSPVDIAGLVMKKDGQIIDNPTEMPRKVSEFPETPYNLIDIEKYVVPIQNLGKEGLIYVTSQGCPFNCKFCSDVVLYKNRWSGWPVERMMKDIRMFYYKYNIDSVMFFDNNFFVDPKRVIDLCNSLIEEKIKINWYADIRIDQINKFKDDELKLIKDAGGTNFLVGTESGNNEILQLLNKRIVVEDIITAAQKCKKVGIRMIHSFMSGFPEVYKQEFNDTLTLIERLRTIDNETMVIMCTYAPYPGTELFDKYKEIVTMPKTLEQWSEYTQLNSNTNWMDAEHDNMLQSVSHFYVQCALSTQDTWKAIKLLGEKYILIKLAHRFFQTLAILRLRHKFYKFRIEEAMVNFPLKIRRGIIKTLKTLK
ncbi:Fe-S protein, radical SAM family [Candidatus Magnetoovum chiemensis]|nr:Fe-S protein, radical SAM family [Candidatus Magnetoovum chiemensis]